MNAMTWVLRVAPADSLAVTRLVLVAVLALLLAVGRSWSPALFVLAVAAVLVVHAGAGQRRAARDRRSSGITHPDAAVADTPTTTGRRPGTHIPEED